VVPVAAMCTTYSVVPAMQCLPGQVSKETHGVSPEKYAHRSLMKVAV
jgi:hypothetical protein